ncbi:ATP-binding protein [Streptomyces halstedii]|uniref:ATP-binding protein n=1 Tax=Streptomyces halstedii TaxID=1944 RepID=UPI00346170DA
MSQIISAAAGTNARAMGARLPESSHAAPVAPHLTSALARHTAMDIAPYAEACGQARHWARIALSDWAHPGDVDDALLVVSELVTNAVLHACSPIRACLNLHTDNTLHLAVYDGGPAARETPRTPHDEHGRGLDIVAALTAGHGRDAAPSPFRSRTWATLTAS